MKLVKRAADALGEIEQATDADAASAMEGLQHAVDSFFAAEEARREVARSCKERVDAARVAFKENVEESVKTGTKEELVGKLRRIEGSWQDLEESIAFAKESKKAATEELSAAREALKRAITETKQLKLL